MKNVADIYPLSPMQQLMLLHTLSAPQTDLLFNQVSYEIDGPLDREVLAQAWQQLVDRHPVLRTAFVWDKLKKPMQVVRQQMALPLAYEDWREQSAEAQQARLTAFLQADRAQRFDATKAPLLRVSLLHLADHRYHLVWSSHHLLLDRWAIPLVLDEVGTVYDALQNGRIPQLPPVHPYRDYIAWLQEQDEAQAAAYWQHLLDGVSSPTLFAPGAGQVKAEYDEHDLYLTAETTAALRQMAQTNQLTMNTLLQGAWAILLSRYTNSSDIVFGATVSGRPPVLVGVESILGSFINNVPVRATITADSPLAPWLRSLQEQQLQSQAYEYCSAAQIQSWSRLPQHLPLFDTLIVFQSPVRWRYGDLLSWRLLEGTLRTHFPLTLAAQAQDERLHIRFVYDRHCFSDEAITAIAHALTHLLSLMAGAAAQPLTSVLAQMPHYSAPHRPRPEIRPVPAAAYPTDQGMEARLVQLWQSLLSKRSVGLTDNFFDHGGTSLQAMRLFMAVQEEFSVNLPLSVLIKDATIEQIATHIRAELGEPENRVAAWSNLVDIQPHGDRPPFFCIHGLTGDVLWFRELGACMAPDQPFYGLQAQGLDGAQPGIDSIGEMATLYIDTIRSLQPDGPYFFGGASFGGTVALEMAQQLRAQGETVALLVMFDHVPLTASYPAPPKWQQAPRLLWSRLGNMPYWLNSFIQLGPARILLRARRKARLLVKSVGRRFGLAANEVASADVIDYADMLPPHRQRLIEAHSRAINSYQPQPYDGRVTLFQAKAKPLLHNLDGEYAWRCFGKGERVRIVVPGSHEGMFQQPRVEKLAAELRQQLHMARGNRATEPDEKMATTSANGR
jgi:thioesterase domain-containing protein/acyl carrier protein